MKFPDRNIVESIRAEYPPGTRVILERMDDKFAPPIGTMGTVTGVDDTGSICIAWDNGSGLNAVYGEDRVRKMIMTDKVFRQIMDIRSSGLVNMLAINEVQRLAFDREYYELVNYIEEHGSEYTTFIIFGKERRE